MRRMSRLFSKYGHTIFLFLLALHSAWGSPLKLNTPDDAAFPNGQRLSLYASKWEVKELHAENWTSVDLPHFIHGQEEYAWRTHFTLDSSLVTDYYRITLQDVKGRYNLYLNGHILGNHHGTVPASFDVHKEDIFIAGQNELLLHIDSRLDFENSVPLYPRPGGIPVAGAGILGDIILTTNKEPFSVAKAETPRQPLVDFIRGQKIKGVEWILDRRLYGMDAEPLQQTITRDLATVMDLKANVLRLFPEPPPLYFFEKCDSLGIRLLVDIPILDVPPQMWENGIYMKGAISVLQEIITTLKNHPSIMAWGLGSGHIGNNIYDLRALEQLAAAARELDDRPVYASFAVPIQAGIKAPVDLQILEIPVDDIEKLINSSLEINREIPAIFRMTFLLPRDDDQVSGAEQQQAIEAAQWIEKANNINLSGIMISPLRDWYGDTPHAQWGARRQANEFTAGLVDATGRRRPAFEVVRAAFQAIAPSVEASHTDKKGTTILFQVVSFVLLLLVLFFFKTDRRLRNHLRRIFLYPHGFYTDLCENRRVNPFLSGFVGFSVILTTSIILAILFYYLISSTLFDTFLNWLFVDPGRKFKAIWVCAHPLAAMALCSLLIGAAVMLFAFIIKIQVLIQGRFIKLSRIITFLYWMPANILFALPFAVVLYRLLVQSSFVKPALVYIAVIYLWFAVRLFRGVKVVLEFSFIKAVLFFILVFGIPLSLAFLYLNSNRSLLSYMEYFYLIFSSG
jgi:hypothetical protein